jgi:hypothetical protein
MPIAPEILLIAEDASETLDIWYMGASQVLYNSATITFGLGTSTSSVKYRYYVTGSPGGTLQASNSQTVTLTGLLPNTSYTIEATPYQMQNAAGLYGNKKAISFKTPVQSTAATVVQSINVDPVDAITKGMLAKILEQESASADVNLGSQTDGSGYTQEVIPASGAQSSSLKPTNSVFQLSNTSKDVNSYISAEKTFDIDTDVDYYSFGTTIYLKPAENTSSINSGGINIFSDNLGRQGYFLEVQTSNVGYIRSSNPIRLLKIKDGQRYPIDDSQDLDIQKYGEVLGGSSYKIDVLVKRSATKVDFIIYINGFMITARDVDTDAAKSIMPATAKVSLIASAGTVYFDYVYAMNITDQDYKNSNIFNIYDGKFSDATLSLAFGDRVISSSTKEPRKASIDEFGTVAREIKKFSFKYKTPSYPAYPTTGANNLVKIIGQKLDSFKAEIYVINNSGMFVSLVDDESNSLWLLGKSVSKSNYSEYEDVSLNKYNNPQPVIFESKWIQKLSDAKSLADWIKNTWSSKKQILNISSFGNPLLSVGDIINVHYPYNGMDGSGPSAQRYVITSVSHSYNDGLSTEITCRTL